MSPKVYEKLLWLVSGAIVILSVLILNRMLDGAILNYGQPHLEAMTKVINGFLDNYLKYLRPAATAIIALYGLAATFINFRALKVARSKWFYALILGGIAVGLLFSITEFRHAWKEESQQNELENKIGEFGNHFDRKTAEIRARIDASQSAIEKDFDDKIKQVDGRITSTTKIWSQDFREQLSTVNGKIEARGKSLQDSLRQKFSRIENQVQSTVRALEDTIRTRSDYSHAQLKSTAEVLQVDFQRKLSQVDARIDSASRDLHDKMNKRLNQLDGKVDSTKKEQQEIINEVNSLKDLVASRALQDSILGVINQLRMELQRPEQISTPPTISYQ